MYFLMTQVSLYIGDKLTEKFFLDRFLELCKSEGFYVRRVCASIMGEFCTIMSKETVQNKLLSTYADLCLDSIWGVRKTSVDVMISVARCVPVSVRRQLLSKLLVRHLRDESRWVRRSAYEILGPFISTFAKQFYEIICDQKGELILIHEYKGGVPRFNVVPVAKVSDILIENLADVNSYYCKQTKPQDKVPTYKFQGKKIALAKLLRRQMLNEDYSDDNQNDSDQMKNISDYKNANTDESENFNVFQYYYNPPDMALDPELVKSIINDNDPPLNDNEEKPRTDESNNENANVEKSEEYEDSNKNIENSEPVTQDSNENNENYDNRQESSNDDNDNTVEPLSNEDVSQTDSTANSKGKRAGKRYQTYSDTARMYMSKERENYKEDDEEKEEEEEGSQENNQSKPTISVYSELTETMKLHSYESSENLDKTFEQSNSSVNLDDFEDDEEDGEIVPRILVDYFVSMSELKSNVVNDLGPDIDYHCAYSFPAIVLTLGRENWHRLKDAYWRLASAVAWKVRSTLASSIHEIAMIIEKDYAARDLVPIYNGFIKDLDEVRIGALKHFSKFLKVLSPQDRTQYLPKLNDFLITDSKWNWRLKEELVHQLSKIIHYSLYKHTDVAEYISPLLLQLIQDRVAAVRVEAIDVISQTLAYLDTYSDDSLSLAMIREIRDLLMAHAAERWSIRQTYPLICSTVMDKGSVEAKVFAKELLPYLLELADDKVPTVRLVVARTLVRDYYPYCYDPEIRNQVHQKLKMMQSDSDRDVREFANELED